MSEQDKGARGLSTIHYLAIAAITAAGFALYGIREHDLRARKHLSSLVFKREALRYKEYTRRTRLQMMKSRISMLEKKQNSNPHPRDQRDLESTRKHYIELKQYDNDVNAEIAKLNQQIRAARKPLLFGRF